MNCDEARKLIHAYVDGELDLVRAMAIEWHLDECPACGHLRDQIEATRAAVGKAGLRYAAPSGLAERIRKTVQAAADEDARSTPNPVVSGEISPIGGDLTRRRDAWRWAGWMAAAAAVVIACGTWLMQSSGSRGSAHEQVVEQVVSSHVRSLLADHLFDVASTDQHTVKPWFAGKLDFSPPVEDLADKGFPLKGGRLDVVSDQTVAALVYQRRQHVINLFVWPDEKNTAEPVVALSRRGYHLRTWSDRGMYFCVVSDLNGEELEEFTSELSQRVSRR